MPSWLHPNSPLGLQWGPAPRSGCRWPRQALGSTRTSLLQWAPPRTRRASTAGRSWPPPDDWEKVSKDPNIELFMLHAQGSLIQFHTISFNSQVHFTDSLQHTVFPKKCKNKHLLHLLQGQCDNRSPTAWFVLKEVTPKISSHASTIPQTQIAVIGGANQGYQGSTQMGSTHEYPSKPLMKEKRGKTCKHLGQVQFLEG